MSRLIRLLLLFTLFLTVACGGSEPTNEEPAQPPALATDAPTATVAPVSTIASAPEAAATEPTAAEPLPSPLPVEPPPTNTPEPVLEPEMPTLGLLAFAKEGQLMGMTIDMSSGKPQFSEEFLLSDNSNVVDVKISPNGRFIAYTTGTFDDGHNTLHVVTDGGFDLPIITSDALPFMPDVTELGFGDAEDPFLFTRIINYEWLSDGETLAFSTGIINQGGFSPGAHSDLWTYNIVEGGQIANPFPAGTGAPIYTIAPITNKVVFATSNTIFRADIDGSNREDLIFFEPVNVFEGFYYPTAQWDQNGENTFVTIANPINMETEGNPFLNQTATLYTIPVDAPATELTTIFNIDMFNPPQWTADGTRFGYTQFIDEENYSFMIGDTFTLEEFEYFSSSNAPTFHAWSPAGNHFVYHDFDAYYLRSFDDSLNYSVSLDPDEIFFTAKWLNEDYFFSNSSGTDVAWEIYLAPVGEDPLEFLTEAATGFPAFDVWLP